MTPAVEQGRIRRFSRPGASLFSARRFGRWLAGKALRPVRHCLFHAHARLREASLPKNRDAPSRASERKDLTIDGSSGGDGERWKIPRGFADFGGNFVERANLGFGEKQSAVFRAAGRGLGFDLAREHAAF